MIVKLLTGHSFEILSLKGGCRGSYESTLVKTSNCWKSHAAAQLYLRHIHIPACVVPVKPGIHPYRKNK